MHLCGDVRAFDQGQWALYDLLCMFDVSDMSAQVLLHVASLVVMSDMSGAALLHASMKDYTLHPLEMTDQQIDEWNAELERLHRLRDAREEEEANRLLNKLKMHEDEIIRGKRLTGLRLIDRAIMKEARLADERFIHDPVKRRDAERLTKAKAKAEIIAKAKAKATARKKAKAKARRKAEAKSKGKGKKNCRKKLAPIKRRPREKRVTWLLRIEEREKRRASRRR